MQQFDSLGHVRNSTSGSWYRKQRPEVGGALSARMLCAICTAPHAALLCCADVPLLSSSATQVHSNPNVGRRTAATDWAPMAPGWSPITLTARCVHASLCACEIACAPPWQPPAQEYRRTIALSLR
jgi:hypothetical protein